MTWSTCVSCTWRRQPWSPRWTAPFPAAGGRRALRYAKENPVPPRAPVEGRASINSAIVLSDNYDALETLLEVLEQEAEDRRQRRIGRLRTASRLPAGKTWETFEHDRVPLALRQQLGELASGSFVDRGVNVLAFGLPGTGKTQLCAVGHRLGGSRRRSWSSSQRPTEAGCSRKIPN